MDDSYFAEQMMREWHAEALAEARCAALLRQANEGSRRPNAIRTRCIDLGRSLVKAARAVAFERLCVLPVRKPVTKRSK